MHQVYSDTKIVDKSKLNELVEIIGEFFDNKETRAGALIINHGNGVTSGKILPKVSMMTVTD